MQTAQPKAPVRKLIPTTKVESSSIESVGYDHASNVLQVNFKGPKPGGKPYQYDSVPTEVWAALQQAESVGSFVNKHIVRGGYKSHKLEPLQ